MLWEPWPGKRNATLFIINPPDLLFVVGCPLSIAIIKIYEEVYATCENKQPLGA
jgi:hypothetical protein